MGRQLTNPAAALFSMLSAVIAALNCFLYNELRTREGCDARSFHQLFSLRQGAKFGEFLRCFQAAESRGKVAIDHGSHDVSRRKSADRPEKSPLEKTIGNYG